MASFIPSSPSLLLMLQNTQMNNTRLEMYGRAYQWLIMGPSRKEWWNVSDTDCTVDELKQALESTITTDLLPLS